MQVLPTAGIVVLAAGLISIGAANAAPELSGKYRCEPQPDPCRSGATFTVTQHERTLEIASDKGERAIAQLTSDTTLSVGGPWNMLGVVYGPSIEWSNGTKWLKQ
jgi:hypothetical protein